MRIVIDSNVLFSALIKDSTTRKIILNYNDLFLFPEYIFEEMNNHKAELLQKSGMNQDEFNKLLQIILHKVEIIPNKTTSPYMKEAEALVKDIDHDDDFSVACTLAYADSILWSNDSKLKRIKDIKVKETKEIIELLSNIG